MATRTDDGMTLVWWSPVAARWKQQGDLTETRERHDGGKAARRRGQAATSRRCGLLAAAAALARQAFRLGELLAGLAREPLEAWRTKDIALACHALARLDGAEPGAAATEAHPLGGARASDLEAFLSAVAACLPGRLGGCKPQDVSNVLWATGRLRFRHDGLLQAVSEHLSGAPGALRQFSPQAVSNALLGFGQLRFRHEGVLCALAEHALPRLPEFSEQQVCNLLHALARLEFRHDALLGAVAGSLDARHGRASFGVLTPRRACNLAWVYLRLRAPQRGEVLRAVAAHVRRPGRVATFRARDLAALASACAEGAKGALDSPRAWRCFRRIRP
ncbi:unnamed protein product [Prorocentrum cordatum]|uniref:RNA-editing substrate-binding complex 6 protein domain-containing protein n=1 Tax=Prorocentrum cordatum TaxID=2364126 RepID=A0ABN9X340_9DINO|nr:unnamed protein product [Polarella glacialis]